MTRIARVLLLLTGLTACASSVVRAQAPSLPTIEDVAFVNVSVGVQAQTHTFSSNSSFPLYDETATVTAAPRVGRGFVVDVSGGRRVWRRLFGALGVSMAHANGDGSLVASIPDPLYFNRFATTTTPVSDLGQTTVAINLQAVWIAPLTDTIDVAFSFGPSLMHVKQDVPSVTVTTGTQKVSASTTSESKWTGKAGTVGVDLSVKLSSQYRAGLFVRWAGGEVDLPSAPKLKVGGVQVGGGLRLRF